MSNEPLLWETYWVDASCYRKPPTIWPGSGRNQNGYREDARQKAQPSAAAADEYDDDFLDCQYNTGNVDKTNVETEQSTRDGPSPPLLLPPPRLEVASSSVAPSQALPPLVDSYTNIPIVQDPKNRKIWKAELSIPSIFFARIIGKGGNTKRTLETDSQCRVVIPGHGQTGPIFISSSSGAEYVQQCLNRIMLIVSSARERADFTHFLSIPLVSPATKDAFINFQKLVQSCDQIPDASKVESLFQNPNRLHLTIGMMSLLDDNDRDIAKNALVECIESKIRPMLAGGKLRARVRGIEYMNDDPSAVDVVYAKICDADSSRKLLQKISDTIASTMAQTGLMPRRKDTVKLHVTLMNTKFIRSPSSTTLPKTIDIRKILENFGDFNFGEVLLEQVHLSLLHANSPISDYFANSAVVDL